MVNWCTAEWRIKMGQQLRMCKDTLGWANKGFYGNSKRCEAIKYKMGEG